MLKLLGESGMRNGNLKSFKVCFLKIIDNEEERKINFRVEIFGKYGFIWMIKVLVISNGLD